MHIDMNCFFPSVETVLNPKLKGKPVIVGGRTRRSVVASANYEARRFGVRAAMPIYRAQSLCKTAIILTPNFEAYKDFHHKFISLVREKFTDKIEDVSIDEFYIDATELCEKVEPKLIALRIQNSIKKEIGLSCSIGIAHNKFLAKMASDYKKPLGITQMFEEDIPEKLWPLKIEDMYMVGPRTAILLNKIGIKTIKDLANAKPTLLKETLKNTWESYYLNANGKGDDTIDTEDKMNKSISCSNTFLYDTNDYNTIKKMLLSECEEVWEQIKELGLFPKTISVNIKTTRTNSCIKSFTPKTPIKSFEHFISQCLSLYEKNFMDLTIRLIGISAKNFV